MLGPYQGCSGVRQLLAFVPALGIGADCILLDGGSAVPPRALGGCCAASLCQPAPLHQGTFCSISIPRER